MCSILQVKPCMVPTRRSNTLTMCFTCKITGNIYFCPPLHRHIQCNRLNNKPNSSQKMSNGGSKMCLWLMNIASNFHLSSPLSSNCTMTTPTMFGSVCWTDFTAISPCFHRHIHMPIARPHSRHRPTCRKNENRAGNVNILLLHIQRRWPGFYGSCALVAHHRMVVLWC